MTDTDTRTRPSPWPLAEETLARNPSLAYLWDPSRPVRAATEVDHARIEEAAYAEASCEERRAWVRGCFAGVRPVLPAPPEAEPEPFLEPLPLPALDETTGLPPITDLDRGLAETVQRFLAIHQAQDAAEAKDTAEPVPHDATVAIAAIQDHADAIIAGADEAGAS